MTREEFKTLVKGMKAVYAQPTFIPDQDAFNVWFELLKDIPYQQANVAIQKYMLTEKFPPTIADIRERRKARYRSSPLRQQRHSITDSYGRIILLVHRLRSIELF